MKAKKPFQLYRIRRRMRLSPAAAALAIILLASPLSAQFMVQPVNLAYLSQRADVILQGRIIKVVEEPLPGYPNIPTVSVTVAVDQSLRGVAKKIYTFREVRIGQRPTSAKRSYGVGQRYMLFLPSPSQYGLSSPIGMGQGRFRIAPDSKGRTSVMNEHSNMGLFRDVATAAGAAGKQLTASERRLTAVERGPVALDEFVSLVKSLTTLPRIR
jgi:hypothetical protein